MPEAPGPPTAYTMTPSLSPLSARWMANVISHVSESGSVWSRGTFRVTQLKPLSSEQAFSLTNTGFGWMMTVATAHTPMPMATTRPNTSRGRLDRADIRGMLAAVRTLSIPCGG